MKNIFAEPEIEILNFLCDDEIQKPISGETVDDNEIFPTPSF
jgi:hypothetical protein